jgi:hypothetical protein
VWNSLTIKTLKKKMKKINALILAGMLSMPIYAEKMLIETGIGVNYGGSIGANISKPINSEIELFVGKKLQIKIIAKHCVDKVWNSLQ